MGKFYLLSFFYLLSNFGLAQHSNTARLTTLIGSHIEFNFSSINQYNNGIKITNGTTIGITIADITLATLPGTEPTALVGWSVEVQAYNGQTDIAGTGANILPLNTIQIEATDANGTLSGATFNGMQDLSTTPAVLLSTAVPGHTPANANDHQIDLSYECGIANGSLLGEIPDYYAVEIEIILIPDY